MPENNTSKLNRRDFLKIIAVASGSGLAVKYGLGRATQTRTVSETRLLMGTIVNLTVVGPDRYAAEKAIAACLDRMESLESVLSRFLPESQLSLLNQEGLLESADPALTHLIEESKRLSELTDGAFDVTVKPLVDLYQKADTLPAKAEIDAARQLVGYSNIKIAGEKIALTRPGMSITLDGIAKGYIVDAGIEELNAHGFENVLVEAGGDLMALGEKMPNTPWKIGLQSPRAEMGNLSATFTVINQAVATSGDYMQAFTPDFANHHIIDPRTGYSSREFASVSVTAPDVMTADGLATAVMVMGRVGLALVENLSRVEVYAVTKDGVVLKTSGFFELTSSQ